MIIMYKAIAFGIATLSVIGAVTVIKGIKEHVSVKVEVVDEEIKDACEDINRAEAEGVAREPKSAEAVKEKACKSAEELGKEFREKLNDFESFMSNLTKEGTKEKIKSVADIVIKKAKEAGVEVGEIFEKDSDACESCEDCEECEECESNYCPYEEEDVTADEYFNSSDDDEVYDEEAVEVDEDIDSFDIKD